jgi:hypothetical protein
VATTRVHKSISEKTRAEDERLREELRHADIGKLKKLMAPLIEKETEEPKRHKSKRST